jgi:hypothetical protein
MELTDSFRRFLEGLRAKNVRLNLFEANVCVDFTLLFSSHFLPTDGQIPLL